MALVLVVPVLHAAPAPLRAEMTTLAPVVDLTERRKAVEELVRDNSAWALRIAHSLLRDTTGNVDDADAESAALEALWRAARRFDGRGTFRGFAAVYVRGAVIDFYRSKTHRGKAPRCISLAHPSMAGFEPTSKPENALSGDELRVLALQADLNDRERQCVLALLDGATTDDVARLWGRAPSRVSQVLRAAGRKLRLSYDDGAA
jgi:RNA polymerase sigma factor (sigma-70 family)